MNYTIYQITNTVNNKIYIGMHKTKDLNDGYMGSGKILTRAIAKYGVGNFRKEILHVYDNANDMHNKEKELVNEDFVKNSTTYNLKIGGEGGFDYINSNNLTGGELHRGANLTPELQQRGRDTIKRKIETDPEYAKAYKEKRRNNALKTPTFYKAFTGKKHTIETKKKIGEANSKHQKGKGNSQYGTCWIYNTKLKESKKIKAINLDQYLINDWVLGRKMKF